VYPRIKPDQIRFLGHSPTLFSFGAKQTSIPDHYVTYFLIHANTSGEVSLRSCKKKLCWLSPTWWLRRELDGLLDGLNFTTIVTGDVHPEAVLSHVCQAKKSCPMTISPSLSMGYEYHCSRSFMCADLVVYSSKDNARSIPLSGTNRNNFFFFYVICMTRD
jgi:hypothetical protein